MPSRLNLALQKHVEGHIKEKLQRLVALLHFRPYLRAFPGIYQHGGEFVGVGRLRQFALFDRFPDCLRNRILPAVKRLAQHTSEFRIMFRDLKGHVPKETACASTTPSIDRDHFLEVFPQPFERRNLSISEKRFPTFLLAKVIVFQDLLGEGILAREVMIEGALRNVGKFQDLVDPSCRVASRVYLLEANFDEFFSCSMVRHNPILDWSTPQKDAKMLRDLMKRRFRWRSFRLYWLTGIFSVDDSG